MVQAAGSPDPQSGTGPVQVCRVVGRSDPLEQMYGDHRPRGYVLHSEQDRYTPTAAMRRAATLYHEHQADCVVVEANNGGDYLPALLTELDPTVQ
ncbi:hypothetical protein ABT009_40230 [Streptomyces sp. NPDC002896]|uniref:hypothetical protein n=1 Tax=Streptomyces sp. NPDC002896 TaxID=3154438 RepID=UPI00331E7BF6